MPLICETVLAGDMRELRRLRDASTADMVELRLDGVRDLSVAGAVEGRRLPVLLTCRASWEGGRFDGAEEERLRILGEAITSDADLVDVEWRAERRHLPPTAAGRLVISHHDFSGVPTDVDTRAAAMRAEEPRAIVKVACAIGALRDLIRLRDVAARDEGKHVVIAMGAAGLISRAVPAAFGSVWTFGGSAAPGQTSVADLVDLYRVRSQTASTRLFALTGMPLAHSASPAMHNAAFAELGIDAVYVPIETGEAEAFLDVARAFQIDGVSVTAPLKRAWNTLGVDIDERGRSVGAVNTLRRKDGRWSATNFDVEGFRAPLRARALDLHARRCVVLGAGGAARAAVSALRAEGARVEISARRTEQAAALAAESGATAVAWPPAPDWDLLVNATPVGTFPVVDAAPVPRAAVQGRAVYDLVYHPRRTQLLKWAHDAGAMTIEGLDMLVAQAGLQFEYWTGRPAPRDVMRRAAEQVLRESAER